MFTNSCLFIDINPHGNFEQMQVLIIPYILSTAAFLWIKRQDIEADKSQRKKPSWKNFQNAITQDGETGAM